jgi:acetoin utilization deacetylase AcuC-like enzyme
VVAGLKQRGILTDPARQLVEPKEAPAEALLDVHVPGYLKQLRSSSLKVAQVMELAPLAVLPSGTLDKKVMAPMVRGPWGSKGGVQKLGYSCCRRVVASDA